MDLEGKPVIIHNQNQKKRLRKKMREEKERKIREEDERKIREEKVRKMREEDERKMREEKVRKMREEDERKMREEKERKMMEEEEKERKISEIMAQLKHWTEVLCEHAHTLPDVKDPEPVVAELKAKLMPFLDMARETAQKSSLVEQTMIRGAIAQMFSTYQIKIALNRLEVYDAVKKTKHLHLKVENEEESASKDSQNKTKSPWLCIVLDIEGTTTPVVTDAKYIVFEDVRDALEKWHSSGIKVYVYSSGSRLAQRLLFRNTDYGDLRKYVSGFFDTTIGNKKESRSYKEITETLGVDDPSEILFVTDVYQEAAAAKAAGLEVIISIRPGNASLPKNHEFKTVTSFSQI